MPISNYNEYMAGYMLRRYHERRKQAIAHLGGQCVACGSSDELEIDHRRRDEKSFSISKLWSVSMAKFWHEVDKCQLLCRNCHQAKTSVECAALRKHGTEWTYHQHKCRCVVCLGAHEKHLADRRRTHALLS